MPSSFSESANGLLKPLFFSACISLFFLSKLLFAHIHHTMAQQPNPRNVFRINLAPHANQSLRFTFQPASDGLVAIDISPGPPTYTRPSFPEHVATSPVPLRELLPDDLKNMFDSDPEDDQDIAIVGVQTAALSTTRRHTPRTNTCTTWGLVFDTWFTSLERPDEGSV